MKRLSFRDPLSSVYVYGNNIIRKLNKKNRDFFEELFKEKFFNEMLSNNWIQNSIIKIKNENTEMHHKKIENFTVVTEMSSYQLYLSGLHTLNIAIKSLEYGYIIKDASAWNNVFIKGNPVFLDIASFEKWNNEKTWIAYGQFIRHFIIPLIINKELRIPISKLFLTDRDGIYPSDAKGKLGLKIFKSPKYLEFILLPSLLSSSKQIRRKKEISNKELNKKILLSILSRLKKKLFSLEPVTNSFWTKYTQRRDHYSNEDIEIKKNIIKTFVKENKGKILDIGCNTGEFLFVASQNSTESHGIDFDENCINYIQKNLKNNNISVSNINFSNPTPKIGWNNEETLSYLEKNYEYFDTVIFFGIMHHLMTIDRIPLKDIINILFKLTKKNLIFEFVSNEDQKFKELSSLNIDLYKCNTQENFEKLILNYFKINKIFNLNYNNERKIYILEKK